MGAVQALAHVAQLAGQRAHALGEGVQQRLGFVRAGEQPLQQCHAVGGRELPGVAAGCCGIGVALPA